MTQQKGRQRTPQGLQSQLKSNILNMTHSYITETGLVQASVFVKEYCVI